MWLLLHDIGFKSLVDKIVAIRVEYDESMHFEHPSISDKLRLGLTCVFQAWSLALGLTAGMLAALTISQMIGSFLGLSFVYRHSCKAFSAT